MKKLLFLSAGLILLLAVFAFGFLDSLSSKNQRQDRDSPASQDLDELDIYLKLFQEFKKINPNRQSFGRKRPVQTPVLNRDPFARPGESYVEREVPISENEAVHQDTLILGGILWDEQIPSAVINGEIVQVGSKLGSFKVARILQQKVILISREDKLVLQMPAERRGAQ